ncbi:hypothetical protein [Helicobacter bizzozeronii]|uniref:hypothetical protein n=1 Tax=Helicobacter bizzozeronii TaxID=56877 RepID=UPI000CEED7EC|nr:hypothetical protein [Helicobacter bizzozeronii]
MRHPQKEQMRAHYESHDISLKELGALYQVPYRTLVRWKNNEKWEAKRAQARVQVEVIKDKLTNHQLNTFLGAKKQEIKDSIKQNLKHLDIDPIVLECMTETSSGWYNLGNKVCFN